MLKERRKNVHAGVRGELIDHTLLGFGPLELPKGQWRAVTYDPYKYATFVDKNTAEAVLNAAKVLILDKKVYANIG